MEIKPPQLDHYDKAIIHFLYHTGEANANTIALHTHMSWQTAITHLRFLKALGYLVEIKKGDITYWDVKR